MKIKEINIEKVGTVKFVKNKRSKNINIRISPFEGIKVSVPFSVSFFEAEKVVLSKTNWILKHLKKVKNIEDKKTIFTEDAEFRTRNHLLVLKKSLGNEISAKVKDGKIIVIYPISLKADNDAVQSIIIRAIEEALRMEAKEYLPRRVKYLAEKYKFDFNRVFIKNNKSRWGSCSKKGNINLSLHLMRLPDELIDYVILHELAHTVEHNHSRKFWDLLDKIYENTKKIDMKLNDYNLKFIF